MMNMILASLLFLLSPPPADLSQAEALIKNGHLKQARALVEPAYKTNPKDAYVLYLTSRIRGAFGDAEGALQLAEQAVALDPSKADYHYQLGLICGEAARNGGMFRQISLGRRVKKEAEIALSLDPKHIGARSMCERRASWDELSRHDRVEGAFAQAQLARAEKDQAGIEAAYLKATQANPPHYGAPPHLLIFTLQRRKRNTTSPRNTREPR